MQATIVRKETLSKSETFRLFYLTENSYNAICQAWAQAINNGFKPNAADMLLYAVIRGKNFKKGFSPVTNEVKLANGYRADYSLDEARGILCYSRNYSVPDFLQAHLKTDIRQIIQKVIFFPVAEGVYKLEDE